MDKRGLSVFRTQWTQVICYSETNLAYISKRIGYKFLFETSSYYKTVGVIKSLSLDKYIQQIPHMFKIKYFYTFHAFLGF